MPYGNLKTFECRKCGELIERPPVSYTAEVNGKKSIVQIKAVIFECPKCKKIYNWRHEKERKSKN